MKMSLDNKKCNVFNNVICKNDAVMSRFILSPLEVNPNILICWCADHKKDAEKILDTIAKFSNAIKLNLNE